MQTPDLRADPPSVSRDIMPAGYRAPVVPLLAADRTWARLRCGGRRREFPKNIIELLETFAAQSALAIQNARLFSEIEEKGRQLESASQHSRTRQHVARTAHTLNAIIGVTEMLREDAADPKREGRVEPLDCMSCAGRHLLGLINDILDCRRSRPPDGGPCRGVRIAPDRRRRQTVETLAAKNRNRLVVDCPLTIGAMQADQTRVRQALLNLLSNANKFTEDGTVTVRAEPRQEAGRD
jgi:signal transduction histidine kinase